MKLPEWLNDKSQWILSIGATVGLGICEILTWRLRGKYEILKMSAAAEIDSIEASDMSQEEKAARKKEVTQEFTKRLAIKAIPLGVTTLATAGLTIGSTVNATHKIEHWMDIARLESERNALIEEKTRVVTGDEKASEIRAEAAREQAGDCTKLSDIMICECGGSELYYDALSGRFFRTNESSIMQAVIACNSRLTNGKEIYITVNEFYEELGAPEVLLGEDYRWTPDRTLEPDLTNTMRVGEGSAVILDWYRGPQIPQRKDMK